MESNSRDCLVILASDTTRQNRLGTRYLFYFASGIGDQLADEVSSERNLQNEC